MTPRSVSPPLALRAVPGRFAVCQLPADAPVEASWLAPGAAFLCVTRTASELSIVCPVADVPAGARIEAPWTAFVVVGTLDFALVGILHRLTGPLADAGVSIFAISTYNTDYLLVPAARTDTAVRAWRTAGFDVLDP